MELDWKGKVIVQKLTEGCTLREACHAAAITRQGVRKRTIASPAFARAIEEAREAGAAERRYRAWLRHPNRGKRGPWWKPGVVPAFRYGRR
jgi:hypothetical protein